MKLFSKPSSEKAEPSIAELEQQEAETAREQALADADHNAEQAAKTRLREKAEQARHKHEDARVKLEHARDQEKRREYVRMAEPVIGTVEAKKKAAVVALSDLVIAMKVAAPIVSSLNGQFVPEFEALTKTIDGATDEFVATIRHHVDRVAIGNIPVQAAPPPAPQPPSLVAAPIEKQTVYLLENARWLEHGEMKCGRKHSWAAIPQHLVAHALSTNLCDLPQSKRTAQTIAAFGVASGAAHPDDCVLISDDAPAAQPAERTLPPQFQERIGPTRQMTIAVDRI